MKKKLALVLAAAMLSSAYCQDAEETIPSQTEERARRPRQEKRGIIWSWR